MVRTSQTVIVDSGFWIAMLDPRDGHHREALAKGDYLDMFQVLCPWPTMYETISTRTVRNPTAIQRYDLFFTKPDFHLIDDAPYRVPALGQVLDFARSGKRRISLVDMVIRRIIEDANVRCNYLLTFNANDFRDVCLKRQVEML